MKRNFLLCGSLGWCLEVFWTGLHSLLNGQPTMMGQTSLLMFPIYGCAAVIAPLYLTCIHSRRCPGLPLYGWYFCY